MSATAPKMDKIAVALTWDGARWPVKSLPAKARAFLGAGFIPSPQKMSQLFANDRVKEVRICWVPRLKGGNGVLCEPFPVATRVAFRAASPVQLGDMLGVVYRRK